VYIMHTRDVVLLLINVTQVFAYPYCGASQVWFLLQSSQELHNWMSLLTRGRNLWDCMKLLQNNRGMSTSTPICLDSLKGRSKHPSSKPPYPKKQTPLSQTRGSNSVGREATGEINVHIQLEIQNAISTTTRNILLLKILVASHLAN